MAAAFRHGVFELLATLVDGPTDEYLPRNEFEFGAKSGFLTDDEYFKERQQVPFKRNVYEEQPSVWPLLSGKLHSAADKFSEAHEMANSSELETKAQCIMGFSFEASPPSGQWIELALVYRELLDLLVNLGRKFDHLCNSASGKGDLDEPSELIACLVELPEKECFRTWSEAYRSFCKEYDEACRARYVLEEEYERLRVEFWTQTLSNSESLRKTLNGYTNCLNFADITKRKQMNFFLLHIGQDLQILTWTNYEARQLKEHVLKHFTQSVATVPEGSSEVHYSNKEELEKPFKDSNKLERWAKILTIQRSLTGNSDYGPKQGAYEREDTLSGVSRTATIVEFNNRISATLTMVAYAAHNLKIFQDVFHKARRLSLVLEDSLQDMYGNLCADELEEAKSNQAKFAEAYRELQSWVQTVPEMGGLRQRLAYNKRAGRGFQWKGKTYQADNPPARTAADTLLHGLSLLDFDCTDNLRVRTVLENGCPRPAPWGREPFGVAVDWLQIPPASSNELAVQSGSKTFDPRRFMEGLSISYGDNGNWKNYWENYDLPVKFDRPYAKPPKVVCWLQTIDTQWKVGLRVWVQAVNVHTHGFQLRFTTWDHSRLWEIGAGWLAYPSECRDDIWTGTYQFSKKKYSSGTKPIPVTFGGEVSFPRPPQVACFLSKLDMNGDSHHRFNAHVERVTKDGMLVRGDSWSDTCLWGADVLCIATSSEK